METKKELKKKKERRNKIAIISLLIFLCFTISNAQEHCDFEDFIKEEIGYLNGGFNSKGRLNLRNINISSMLSKPFISNLGYFPYIGFIDIKIKRRLEINFLKIEKSTTNDSLYIAKGKTKVGKNVRLFEGDIKIKHVYFFAEHSKGLEDDMVGKIKSQGIIIADYHFREDKKLSATGIFEGKVLLRWYINSCRYNWHRFRRLYSSWCSN